MFSNLPTVSTTLRISQPASKEQLIDAMRHIAEQNGLALTTQGSLVRIEPAQARRGDALPEDTLLQKPTVGLYTCHLQYTDAAGIAPLLMAVLVGQALDLSVSMSPEDQDYILGISRQL